MPASFTPVLNLQTPEVGSEVDTWSAVVEANWEIIDGRFVTADAEIYPIGFAPTDRPLLRGIQAVDGNYIVEANIEPAATLAGASFVVQFIDNTDPFSPLAYPAFGILSTASGSSNIALFESVVGLDFNDGDGIAFLRNAAAVPTGNPTNGGYLYVDDGDLKYRGPTGVTTTLAPADSTFPLAVHTYPTDDISPVTPSNGVNQEVEITGNVSLTVDPSDDRGGFFTLTVFNSSGSTRTIFPASDLGTLSANTVTAGDSVVVMFGSTGVSTRILTSYAVSGDARKP